ncbi:fumarylacetoacetate hydrolase family protein [Confluentibacter flavum]|uniref:Fumarylacetoacetase n=1 Tax=Confluentibacter flavum TaxID=1909700 RepID=A0A2N3HI24_9FLAO|nr:fumarylacetoacetate hydrolase family protein [Confluentibacter flavum]PKQ44554.1 fumarylacetoacetase [Confluentibacter flavum]
MRLVTYQNITGTINIGWLKGDGVVDMQKLDKRLPNDMLTFIDNHEAYFKIINDNDLEKLEAHYKLSEVKLLAPLPNPRSFRDYVAFEEHMLNASKSFGHKVSEAWYDMPIFYFTNHQSIYGPNDQIKRPAKETKLDIELEMAVIIGKKGRNIDTDKADNYIFGYTIFNDWTARSIQKHEMTVPLGPHKGKDFANAIGPCIVTKDEFEKYRCTITRETHPEHLAMPTQKEGRFNLRMIARINGETICNGNCNTVHWTFPQMIARASENDVDLMPGDILGSGTVGWGSLIENNFSVHRPLEPGDMVELEIEGIGILKNTII